MTISFRDRLAQVRVAEPTVANETSLQQYQDAVVYPCFPQSGTTRDDDSSIAPVPGQSSTDALLQRLLDITGGGNIPGAYRSITVTIPALEQRYEISLGIYATQLSIRCDKPITLVLNSTVFDNIFLEIADFPVLISQLRLNESIHTLFVTTGSTDTTIKIFAIGSAKTS